MDIYELGKMLNNMYFDSQEGEAVVMIHLFGIKYADEINGRRTSIASAQVRKQ